MSEKGPGHTFWSLRTYKAWQKRQGDFFDDRPLETYTDLCARKTGEELLKRLAGKKNGVAVSPTDGCLVRPGDRLCPHCSTLWYNKEQTFCCVCGEPWPEGLSETESSPRPPDPRTILYDLPHGEDDPKSKG